MGIKNVLYIDDDEDDLEFFSIALHECNPNISCTLLNCARKAQQQLLLREINPNIIFLDLNMPGKDGFQFLAEVQKWPGWTIPIIILSTSSDQQTAASLMNSGALGYIIKPASLKALKNLITPYIEQGVG